MSHPFGGHPKFGHVKTWARNNGITVQDCVTENAVKVTLFHLPSGNVYSVAKLLDGDRLSPTKLGEIERRLGMESDWFSLP